MMLSFKQQDFYACSGCGLCATVCPLWEQYHDINLTPWGRGKLLQSGLSKQALAPFLQACTLCAACEVVCPEQIAIISQTILLRKTNNPEQSKDYHLDNCFFTKRISALFTHDKHLNSAHFSALKNIIAQITQPHVITNNGIVYLYLKKNHPQLTIHALGYYLIAKQHLANYIQPNDLYLLDSQIFHLNYQKSIIKYRRFEKQTGCRLNLDLNRCSPSLCVDQPDWHLTKNQWHKIDMTKHPRIIVENYLEYQYLQNNTDFPVHYIMDFYA